MGKRLNSTDSIVGIVANPRSGRDIRRVVAKASVFPNAEKALMVQRALGAMYAVGVDTALISTDLGGISAAILRASRVGLGERQWPRIEFIETGRITESATDTINAVKEMVELGAKVIVCLGGDGTARAAASASKHVPLLALSTGTNNVFPTKVDATVAGLAAGLIVTGQVGIEKGTYKAARLEMSIGDATEFSLVDLCITDSQRSGSRALWDPSTFRELYCTFAEADAIGLSSVAGLLSPSSRRSRSGVALELGDPDDCEISVVAPIAPGLVRRIGVRSVSVLPLGVETKSGVSRGVAAFDGEREFEFSGEAPVICFCDSGPVCVDTIAVLNEAADIGCLVTRELSDSVDSLKAAARKY